MIVVERNSPRDPQAAALLGQSHALMRALFPPEDNFFLDIAALDVPHIHFFTAREGEVILGTAALKLLDGYGEVKSMFVADAARGKGAGDALLRQLIDDARAEGLPVIRLETGNLLHAAHRLYARHGFVPCGLFGDYHAAPSSLFMELVL
jgi:putative acetyltransferase